MMNLHAWIAVVASVVAGCASTEALKKADGPPSSAIAAAAPAATADGHRGPDTLPTTPLVDPPRAATMLCAAVEPSATAVPREAATPHDARRGSEALDRLALRIRIHDERRGKVITLRSDDLVEPGQWALAPTASFPLDVLVAALAQQEGHIIVVQGYTDSSGAAAFNEALSLRRAQAVCDYLVMHGVPVKWLRIEGLGARRPVADNATAEGRSQNRRVEIVISH